MAIHKGDVRLAPMPKPLRSGGPIGEVDVPRGPKRRAHELIRPRCVLPITEESAAAGILNLDDADRGGNGFGLPMPHVAGVVVITGVGVSWTVGAPVEAGTLLDLSVGFSLPEQPRFNGGG